MYLVVSDFHADMYTQYAKPLEHESWNDRFQNQLDKLNQIFNMAIENEERVIFNGDLFNSRVDINQVVYSQVVTLIIKRSKELFDTLDDPDHPVVYMLAGNHDQYDNSPIPENSLEVFEIANPAIQVVSKVKTFSDGLGNYLTFVPYSEDTQMLKDQLAQEVDNNKNIPRENKFLFAHVGVSGAVQGRWNHRLGGAFSQKDLKFSKFNQALLGHYHKRQQLADNAWYVGNTIPLNHNDDGMEKGIFEVAKDINQTKFMPLKSPMFYTLSLDDTKLSPDEIQNLIQCNYVRVIVNQKDSLRKLQAKSAKEELNVNISYEPTVKTESRLGISADASTKEIVSKYADKFYPEAKQEALNVLNEANKNLEI